jgi:hypothetical protein
MVIMCVPLVELLCQSMMGWILALEHLLPGAQGSLSPHPIRFPSEVIGCPGPSRAEERVERDDRWQNPSCPQLS